METDTTPWEPTARSLKLIAVRRLLLIIVLIIQTLTILRQGHWLTESYQREVEYNRRTSTLIQENRRLREHCGEFARTTVTPKCYTLSANGPCVIPQ